MNPEELNGWRKSVNNHIEYLNALVEARKILKNQIEEHLKSIFQWNDIEYNRDFSVIKLKWDYGHNPVIKAENIDKLGMDWIISAEYDDKANRIVVVEVYPWGVQEGYQPPE